MNALLKVNNLCKNGILKDIRFTVNTGQMVAIMGPSGSGKSTLLYQVSGMDNADAGQVWLNNTEITALTEDEKAQFRITQMGFVFQQMNMLRNLNIIDNIILPTVGLVRRKRHNTDAYEKALSLMRKMGIEDLAERKITEVSGGQLQRACICRSMMNDPKILFADEPTGALNQTASADVMDEFVRLNKQGVTILIVTHDSKVAAKCERILYLLDGKLDGELDLFSMAQGKEREEKVSRWLAQKKY